MTYCTYQADLLYHERLTFFQWSSLESDRLWAGLLVEELPSALNWSVVSQNFLGCGLISTALNNFIKPHAKYKLVMRMKNCSNIFTAQFQKCFTINPSYIQITSQLVFKALLPPRLSKLGPPKPHPTAAIPIATVGETSKQCTPHMTVETTE